MRGAGGPKKIGDLLGKVLARYSYGQTTARTELEESWQKVAGERIAKHARVGAFRRGVLEVLVDNSTLLQELESFHKQTLLAQLQGTVRHSSIRTLRFRRQ